MVHALAVIGKQVNAEPAFDGRFECARSAHNLEHCSASALVVLHRRRALLPTCRVCLHVALRFKPFLLRIALFHRPNFLRARDMHKSGRGQNIPSPRPFRGTNARVCERRRNRIGGTTAPSTRSPIARSVSCASVLEQRIGRNHRCEQLKYALRTANGVAEATWRAATNRATSARRARTPPGTTLPRREGPWRARRPSSSRRATSWSAGLAGTLEIESDRVCYFRALP